MKYTQGVDILSHKQQNMEIRMQSQSLIVESAKQFVHKYKLCLF